MDEASCLSPNSYFSPAARMPNFRGASGRCAATSFSCVLRGWAHPRRMLDVLAVRAPGLPVPPGRLMGDGRVLLGGIGQRQPRQPERSSRQQTRFAPCLQPAADAVCALPSVRQWIRQREADGTAVVAIPPERDSKQVRPEVFLALPSLGRCLGRPGGGAMPLPEPGCARGWGVGGWSAAPRREGAREHVRFPGLRADADAAVALAPERLGGGRAPASAQARARRELQRRLEEHGVGAAVWPRAGAARVSLDQAEMPAHPPLRRLGPERHGVTRSDTGGHKGRVSSGSEELQEAFPRGSANGDSPPGRMAVERRRRECNSRTNA